MKRRSARGLHLALAAWKRALGEEHVDVDRAALKRAARATFAIDREILALVRPGNTAEVRAVMRAAHRHRVAVYPVSCGKNWGYGSKVPSADRCVLLELSRLNRVLDCDDALGTLTVEPGATFASVHRQLAERGSSLTLTVIGGSPEASLIGNALERGDGRGPHGDVFNHLCGLEVVLPDGRLLHTGMARFTGARSARVHRWGLGPALDGLFSQSNLGVVTRATFWLAPRAEHYRELAAQSPRLAPLVEATRALHQEGTLRSTSFFWDHFKALSVIARPFDAPGARTPLSEAGAARLREHFGLSEWTMTGAIGTATAALADATEARVAQLLTPASSTLRFVSSAADGSPLPQAVPSPRNLAMLYWRKRRAVDPARVAPEDDLCGCLWLTCAVPFTGADAESAMEIAGRVPPMFGFEPNRALIALSPRCLYAVAAVLYDREREGEDTRAMRCHDAMLRELTEAGFPPCRLGVQTRKLPDAEDDWLAAVRALKQAWDPRGVLAPGRYGL